VNYNTFRSEGILIFTLQRQRLYYVISFLSLYRFQSLSHNFFSLIVNTTCIFLARCVSTWADVNRSIRIRRRGRQREGATTCLRISHSYASWESGRETERGRKREKGRKRSLRPKAGSDKSEEDGEEKRRELRGRLVVKMKAPPLVLAPFVRRRRNRPIDSRIYRGGGMIQPDRLPRSLPPTTRDARDPRASVYDDPPFDDRSSHATALRRSAPL